MSAPKPEDDLRESGDGPPARPCPICGKPAAVATSPFCSKRCADIDLHRWLGGIYAIPVSGEPNAAAESVRKEASDQDSEE